MAAGSPARAPAAKSDAQALLGRGPLPRRLRRRFLRHLRAYWDMHRHRVPGATRERIELLRNKKQLEIEAGRLIETRRIQNGNPSG